eukprot:5477850-Pleurochrysis_carterae.AAC.5
MHLLDVRASGGDYDEIALSRMKRCHPARSSVQSGDARSPAALFSLAPRVRLGLPLCATRLRRRVGRVGALLAKRGLWLERQAQAQIEACAQPRAKAARAPLELCRLLIVAGRVKTLAQLRRARQGQTALRRSTLLCALPRRRRRLRLLRLRHRKGDIQPQVERLAAACPVRPVRVIRPLASIDLLEPFLSLRGAGGCDARTKRSLLCCSADRGSITGSSVHSLAACVAARAWRAALRKLDVLVLVCAAHAPVGVALAVAVAAARAAAAAAAAAAAVAVRLERVVDHGVECDDAFTRALTHCFACALACALSLSIPLWLRAHVRRGSGRRSARAATLSGHGRHRVERVLALRAHHVAVRSAGPARAAVYCGSPLSSSLCARRRLLGISALLRILFIILGIFEALSTLDPQPGQAAAAQALRRDGSCSLRFCRQATLRWAD